MRRAIFHRFGNGPLLRTWRSVSASPLAVGPSRSGHVPSSSLPAPTQALPYLSTLQKVSISECFLIFRVPRERFASQVGAFDDVEKAKASRNIRRGKGKMRNRRYVARKGPLVVLGPGDESGKAFRNLPGVEVAHVDRLNLLQARRLMIIDSVHGGHASTLLGCIKYILPKLGRSGRLLLLACMPSRLRGEVSNVVICYCAP